MELDLQSYDFHHFSDMVICSDETINYQAAVATLFIQVCICLDYDNYEHDILGYLNKNILNYYTEWRYEENTWIAICETFWVF